MYLVLNQVKPDAFDGIQIHVMSGLVCTKIRIYKILLTKISTPFIKIEIIYRRTVLMLKLKI